MTARYLEKPDLASAYARTISSWLKLAFRPLRCAAGGLETEFFTLLRPRIALQITEDLEVFSLLWNNLGNSAGKPQPHYLDPRLVSVFSPLYRHTLPRKQTF